MSVSLGVVEAARSSRVTQTRKPSSLVQNAQIRGLFLIKNASFFVVFAQWIDFGFRACYRRLVFSTNFLRIYSRIFYESAPKHALKPALRDLVAAKKLYFFFVDAASSAPYTGISLALRRVLISFSFCEKQRLGNSRFLNFGYVSF